MQICYLADYDDATRFPNIAVLQFTQDREAVLAAAIGSKDDKLGEQIAAREDRHSDKFDMGEICGDDTTQTDPHNPRKASKKSSTKNRSCKSKK